MRKVVLALAATASAAAPSGVSAATSNGAISTSATVEATCSITANPLDFGVYSSAQVDVTGAIAVTCSDSAPYTIYLGVGNGPGATADARVMVNGAQTLNYTLYSTLGSRGSGGPVVWGSSGRGGPAGVSGYGTGSAQNYTVYGRMFPGQSGTAGAYTDTVTVTLSY